MKFESSPLQAIAYVIIDLSHICQNLDVKTVSAFINLSEIFPVEIRFKSFPLQVITSVTINSSQIRQE